MIKIIIGKYSKTKWNSKTKKYYVDLGYEYTKIGDEFDVKVEHLTSSSRALVEIKCDFCEAVFFNSIEKRNKNIKKSICKKDACPKIECIELKIKESNIEKCGTEHHISSKEVRNKINKTFVDKYGVENPFQLDSVKSKIRNTNMEKYGVECFVHTEEYKLKTLKTNLEKYGVAIPMRNKEVAKRVSDALKGEKSYQWKGGISKENTRLISTMEYREWRRLVYERDFYTCQCCNKKGGNLNAHHIINFADNEDSRFDIENGITICVKCHSEFHKIYGRKDNNFNQLETFISNKVKTYAELTGIEL